VLTDLFRCDCDKPYHCHAAADADPVFSCQYRTVILAVLWCQVNWTSVLFTYC